MPFLRERLAERWWRLAYLLSFPVILVAVALAVASAFVSWYLAGLFLLWVLILLGEVLSYRRRQRRA